MTEGNCLHPVIYGVVCCLFVWLMFFVSFVYCVSCLCTPCNSCGDLATSSPTTSSGRKTLDVKVYIVGGGHAEQIVIIIVSSSSSSSCRSGSSTSSVIIISGSSSSSSSSRSNSSNSNSNIYIYIYTYMCYNSSYQSVASMYDYMIMLTTIEVLDRHAEELVIIINTISIVQNTLRQ